MRPVWKGAVSFGLVNIPVKMYPASEDKSIKFKYLHSTCKAPVKYKKVCSRCGQTVEQDEIVRGYEYQRDRFVIMNEEDFAAVAAQKTRTIDIIDFCRLEEIDPIYFEKSYYLGPEETGKKAYDLLVAVFKKTARVAVAKVVIRTRQALAAIRIYQDVLVMETMKYPDEVRSPMDVPDVTAETAVSDRELDMAVKLVEGMTEPFVPEKYTDDYRKGLLELISAKIEGQEPILEPEQEQPEGVIDLMESLRASLEAMEKERFAPAAGRRREKGRVG